MCVDCSHANFSFSLSQCCNPKLLYIERLYIISSNMYQNQKSINILTSSRFFYTLCSNYENSGNTLRGQGCQGSSNTLRNNYEHSGSTLRGTGIARILLYSSQHLRKLRENSTGSGILLPTPRSSKYENSGSTLRGQGSSYPLLPLLAAANMKTQGALYVVRDPPTHSSQQL